MDFWKEGGCQVRGKNVCQLSRSQVLGQNLASKLGTGPHCADVDLAVGRGRGNSSRAGEATFLPRGGTILLPETQWGRRSDGSVTNQPLTGNRLGLEGPTVRNDERRSVASVESGRRELSPGQQS